MRTFNPHSGHPARAVQAWQILVGRAMNRQTVTYDGLSRLMYGKRAAVFWRASSGASPSIASTTACRR
jgi:hypothetical protein